MAQLSTTQGTPAYYLPPPMAWPIIGSVGLFCMAVGGVLIFNAMGGGWVAFSLGIRFFGTWRRTKRVMPDLLMVAFSIATLIAVGLSML